MFSILLSILLSGDILHGKVVGVHDGDTLTVLVGTTQHKIRLAGIDAPESKQPFGTRSQQSLSEMTFGKAVTVDVETKDRYGREVGTVHAGKVNANLEQVRRGMAWHYKQYSKDQTLADAETAARAAKAGLWIDEKPIPPWEWRKARRTK